MLNYRTEHKVDPPETTLVVWHLFLSLSLCMYFSSTLPVLLLCLYTALCSLLPPIFLCQPDLSSKQNVPKSHKQFSAVLHYFLFLHSCLSFGSLFVSKPIILFLSMPLKHTQFFKRNKHLSNKKESRRRWATLKAHQRPEKDEK